jgi:hypothetical protein
LLRRSGPGRSSGQPDRPRSIPLRSSPPGFLRSSISLSNRKPGGPLLVFETLRVSRAGLVFAVAKLRHGVDRGLCRFVNGPDIREIPAHHCRTAVQHLAMPCAFRRQSLDRPYRVSTTARAIGDKTIRQPALSCATKVTVSLI